MTFEQILENAEADTLREYIISQFYATPKGVREVLKEGVIEFINEQ